MANTPTPWNAADSYIPLSAATNVAPPVPAATTGVPPRRVLIRLPDLKAVVADEASAGTLTGTAGSLASPEHSGTVVTSLAPGGFAPAGTADASTSGREADSASAEQVQRANLRAALVRVVIAYLTQLARHPRALAGGSLVAVAQFFLLMLLDGRLTITEPTAKVNAATQNQIVGADWLPPAVAPEAAEAPRWTAAIAPVDTTPSSGVPIDAASEAPAFEPPATQRPDAAPWNEPSSSTEVESGAQSNSARPRMTTAEAAALMARRPESIPSASTLTTRPPGVARLRGQIVPQDLRREPPISSDPGMQP
ncbi:MAG: hypothetical protein K2Y37_18510 [Pirellulales bacterium]|nr:hypothetical protein [Pirellulales bacterium]